MIAIVNSIYNALVYMMLTLQPSILGATVPSENLLNFKELIPEGRYSSNKGSTDSFMTASAA